jgi:hypothetical protein
MKRRASIATLWKMRSRRDSYPSVALPIATSASGIIALNGRYGSQGSLEESR